MTTLETPDAVSVLMNIQFLLFGILVAILFGIAVIFAWALQTRKQFQWAAKMQDVRQFQAHASVMLSEAQYEALKQLCSERLQGSPGDATAYYYDGMAHWRCHEYVEAKRRFETLMKLDATWKKVATSHLEAIEAALKKAKPVLVDGDR
jgi:hypothetical protein